ncbi:MAG: hypothetical protein KA330_12070 [Chitinophagaceae bacterium]|jgi:hypothetical protein|nr:hypothetical protein [Chitinophagaceae bacterium]MBP6417184.1 hypothetical protein [Chitinophagaceae bacterium]MBP9883428.1 hypothetical protein [Chitinophagales bacterium]
MTKKGKSITRSKPVYSKIKDPVKPMWMRVTKIVTLIVLGAIMVIAIAAYMMKYYQLISNHK